MIISLFHRFERDELVFLIIISLLECPSIERSWLNDNARRRYVERSGTSFPSSFSVQQRRICTGKESCVGLNFPWQGQKSSSLE